MTKLFNSSLILCSTPRLARSLQGIFQREQLRKGIVKWQPLNAVPLSQWLGQVLDEAILLGEIDAAKAIRAVDLSIKKYCSVAETLRAAGAEIKYKIFVNDQEVFGQ